jgi:hypothetical protein
MRGTRIAIHAGARPVRRSEEASQPLLAGNWHPARRRMAALEEALTFCARRNACVAIETYVRAGFIGAVYRERNALLKCVDKLWRMAVRCPRAEAIGSARLSQVAA